VCDWLVTVKVRGTLVVGVTCRNRGENEKRMRKQQQNKTTTTIIKITITIIKVMENVDTDNRGKKMCIIICLYQNINDKQLR